MRSTVPSPDVIFLLPPESDGQELAGQDFVVSGTDGDTREGNMVQLHMPGVIYNDSQGDFQTDDYPLVQVNFTGAQSWVRFPGAELDSTNSLAAMGLIAVAVELHYEAERC